MEPMNIDEVDKFVGMMIRRGVAIQLKQSHPDVFLKHIKAYEELDRYLRENRRRFAVYVITGGFRTGKINEDCVWFIGECFEPVWAKIRDAYGNNDWYAMIRYLSLLHKVYKAISNA